LKQVTDDRAITIVITEVSN